MGVVETGPTPQRATLLPDPEPREVRVPVSSVDDHLIEPRDLFEGRLPAALQDAAPKVVELEHGAEAWVFEGNLYPNVGLNAVVGRRCRNIRAAFRRSAPGPCSTPPSAARRLR